MIQAKTRVGGLDQWVTIQTPTQTVDNYGGPVVTFADLQSVWAAVEYPVAGSSEGYADAVNLASNRVRFTVHFREDFDERARIVWNSRQYDILRIEHEGRRMFTIVTAEYRK